MSTFAIPPDAEHLIERLSLNAIGRRISIRNEPRMIELGDEYRDLAREAGHMLSLYTARRLLLLIEASLLDEDDVDPAGTLRSVIAEIDTAMERYAEPAYARAAE